MGRGGQKSNKETEIDEIPTRNHARWNEEPPILDGVRCSLATLALRLRAASPALHRATHPLTCPTDCPFESISYSEWAEEADSESENE
jgi:hypothetical protein